MLLPHGTLAVHNLRHSPACTKTGMYWLLTTGWVCLFGSSNTENVFPEMLRATLLFSLLIPLALSAPGERFIGSHTARSAQCSAPFVHGIAIGVVLVDLRDHVEIT
jgi:hypothetical protein